MQVSTSKTWILHEEASISKSGQLVHANLFVLGLCVPLTINNQAYNMENSNKINC